MRNPLLHLLPLWAAGFTAGATQPSEAQGPRPDTTRGARTPAAPPALARLRGWMPLAATGVPQFLTAHPEWDGRGVLIAILDSGVDPGAPGLQTTSTGEPKILDLRDFSGEAQVTLRPVTPQGDTVRFGSRRLAGMSRVRNAAPGPWYAGWFLERPLGSVPSADVNDDGDNADSLLVLAGKGREGWMLFVDADGDGSFGNDQPVRDYLLGRETFGWHRPGLPAPLLLAANFGGDSAAVPRLRLAFDTEAHGTHVAGIAAGFRIGGEAGLNGVAPGAQILGLKISRNDFGGITTTGSVVAALDYAIRFAADRSLPLVVNLSFGVGNEREGAARLDAVLDSILAANPQVIFLTSAGNDGPGLSTMGFPGSARRAITVGAIQAAPFLPPAAPKGLTPVIYFSSRGGELAKPDLVAPGTAYSTVPGWNVGDEIKSGTSMAAPHGAGLAALLLSAASAERRSVTVAEIRNALVSSASPVRGETPLDAGAGIPDLEAAWRILQHPGAGPRFEVDLPGRPGATAGFAVGRGDSLLTFRLTREAGTDPVELRFTSDAPWLKAPEPRRIDGASTLITVKQTPPAEPGTWTGAIRGMIAGRSGAAFTLRSTVVIPQGTVPGPVSLVSRVSPGGQQRVWFAADSARPFQVRIASEAGNQPLVASLHQPGGQPVLGDNGIPAGPDSLAAVFDVDGRDARRGLYEAVATGWFEVPANARIEVHHAPARLEIARGGEADSLVATLRGVTDSVALGAFRFGLLGAERSLTVDTSGSADIRIPLAIPRWASELVAELEFEPEQWPRFTDFGFAAVDRTGAILEKEPANYSRTRMTVGIPPSLAGSPLDLVLAPGFTDPGSGERWRARVTIRFHAAEPVVLAAREGETFRLLPRGTASFHARLENPPWPIPDGFAPLLLFLLESGPAAWTWQRALAR